MIADLNSYQQETGAYKFHALAYTVDVCGSSQNEYGEICIVEIYAPVHFEPTCGVRLGLIS